MKVTKKRRFVTDLHKNSPDHLVCTKSGKIEEFVDEELETLKGRVAYRPTSARRALLSILGLYSACAKTNGLVGCHS